MEEFKTILCDETVQIVEKKSKFIADLCYVKSQEEAEVVLRGIRKKYFDAKHHCFAYRVLQDGRLIERTSDDGEPSGTAGAPMLNILKKNDLMNVIVVVTRYFGGILLGTGGLVRAYSDATLLSIDSATLVKKVLGVELEVVIDYSSLEKFKYFCVKNGAEIVDSKYTDKVLLVCYFRREILELLLLPENVSELGVLSYRVGEDVYINLKE